MRKPWLALLASALATAVVLPLACGSAAPADARLDLADLVPADTASPPRADQSTLRFAVAAVLSPRATLKSYEGLAQYLGSRTGRSVELVQGRSYAEINALVRTGDVAFALVCSGAYVAGRNEFGMEAIAVPVVNGQATYQSYVIVPWDSDAYSWADLRGMTFAFTDPLSNSGRLVPVYVLSRLGATPETYFKEYTFTYSHDRSIAAVAQRLVDAAAVDSLVFDYMVERDPSLSTKVRVIWRSPPYGINPIVVSPSIDPALRRQLRSLLLEMVINTRGKRVLESLGVDRFKEPDPGAYREIEMMLRETAPQEG